MIFETFRQAIQNVWSNKLRTFLTMLGIIIGVSSICAIVERYGGLYSFSVKEGKFVLRVSL